MHFFNSSVTSFRKVKVAHVSSSGLFIILRVTLATTMLSICLRWSDLPRASQSQIWTWTWDQTLAACYLVHPLGFSSQRKPLKEGQGCIVLSYPRPSLQSSSGLLSLRAPGYWNPTWIMHFPLPLFLQISYLYKHFLDCLSSHTAQELTHNSTEQTSELGDLWFLWVRLRVVFVPIKQWK